MHVLIKLKKKIMENFFLFFGLRGDLLVSKYILALHFNICINLTFKK